MLDVPDIPAEIRPAAAAGAASGLAPGISLQEAERILIERTLAMTGGNRQQTAQTLGIGERTLYRKIKDYGLK
jgi:two-component system response regulator HydG